MRILRRGAAGASRSGCLSLEVRQQALQIRRAIRKSPRRHCDRRPCRRHAPHPGVGHGEPGARLVQLGVGLHRLPEHLLRDRGLPHGEPHHRLVRERARIAGLPLQDLCRLVPGRHVVPPLDAELRERKTRLEVVRIARDRRLDLRFFRGGGGVGGRATPLWKIAGERPAGLARLRREVDEETQKENGGRAADSPEEPAQGGLVRRLRASCRADGRGRFPAGGAQLLEGQERAGRVQLELVALLRELRGSPLGGGVLHLLKLAHQGIPLAREVAHLHARREARVPAGSPRGRHGLPGQHGAGQEPDAEHGERWQPVHRGGRVHGRETGG